MGEHVLLIKVSPFVKHEMKLTIMFLLENIFLLITRGLLLVSSVPKTETFNSGAL
jgi:hypothetical protein